MGKRKCPVCSSVKINHWSSVKDLEYSSTIETYHYYKCNSCNSIFLNSFPTDKLSTIYPHNYYSFQDQKKSLALRVKNYLDRQLFKKLLSQFENKAINILDVGGGSGWLLDSIKEVYPNVKKSQIIDIDENAKVKAEKNGHEFFHGTVEAFESGTTYDLILMLNLIEHIGNPRNTLNALSKILNPRGLILIKTPNIDSLDARLFRKSYWGGLHCPRHWILFSKQSFEQLIEETPLKIKNLKYTQGAPFWTWSILAKLKEKKIVSTSKDRPMFQHPLVPFLNVLFASFDFLRGIFGFKTSQMFIELEKR